LRILSSFKPFCTAAMTCASCTVWLFGPGNFWSFKVRRVVNQWLEPLLDARRIRGLTWRTRGFLRNAKAT